MRGDKASTSSAAASSPLRKIRTLSPPPPARRHDELEVETDGAPISPSRKMKESLVHRVNKTRQYRHWAALTVQLGMEDAAGVVTDTTSLKSASESSSKSAESRQERIAEKRTALAKAQQYQRNHTPTREVQPGVSPAKQRHSSTTPNTNTNTAPSSNSNAPNEQPRYHQPTVSPARLRGLRGVPAITTSTTTAAAVISSTSAAAANANPAAAAAPSTKTTPTVVATAPAEQTPPPQPTVSPRLRTFRSFPVDMIKQVDTSVLERKVNTNTNTPKSPVADTKAKASTTATSAATATTTAALSKQEYSLSVFKQKRALAVFQESVKNSPERKAKVEAKIQQRDKATDLSPQKRQQQNNNKSNTMQQESGTKQFGKKQEPTSTPPPNIVKQKTSWNKPDHALALQSPPQTSAGDEGPDDEVQDDCNGAPNPTATTKTTEMAPTQQHMRVKSPLRTWNKPDHALKRAVSPLYQRKWNNHNAAMQQIIKKEAEEKDASRRLQEPANSSTQKPTPVYKSPARDRSQITKTPPPTDRSNANLARKSPTAERYRLARDRHASTTPAPMRMDTPDEQPDDNEQHRPGIETPHKVSVSSMKERFGGTAAKRTPSTAVRPSPIRFRRAVEPMSAPPKLRSITPTPPEDRAISPSDTDLILDVQESGSDEIVSAIIETPGKVSVADMKSRFGSKPNVLSNNKARTKGLPRQNSTPKIQSKAPELELFSSKSADDRPTRIIYENREEYPDPPLEQMSDLSEENRLIIETPDKVSVHNMRARFNPTNPTKKWQKPVSVATANTLSRTAGRYRAPSPPPPAVASARDMSTTEEARPMPEATTTGAAPEDTRVTIETPDKVSVSSMKDMFMNNTRVKPGPHPSRRTATPVTLIPSGRTTTPSTPPHGLRSGSRVDVSTPRAPTIPQRQVENESGPEMPELESSQSPGRRIINTQNTSNLVTSNAAKQIWQNGVLKREKANNNVPTAKPRWTPTSPQPAPRKFGPTNSAERKTPAVWKRISPSIAGMLDGADAELLNREFAAQAANDDDGDEYMTPGKNDAITRMERKLQRRDRHLVPPDSPFGSSYMMDVSVDTSPAQQTPHHHDQPRYSGNVNMSSLPEDEPAAINLHDPGYQTPPPDPAEFVEVESDETDEQQQEEEELAMVTSPNNNSSITTPRSRQQRPWQTDLETTSPRSWNMLVGEQQQQQHPFDDGSASRTDSKSTQQTPIHMNVSPQKRNLPSSLDRYAEEKKVENDTLSVHSLRKMAADSIHAVDFDNAMVNNNDHMMTYQLDDDDNSQNSSLMGDGNTIPQDLPPEVAKALSWTNEETPTTRTPATTNNHFNHYSVGKSGAELDLALSESDSESEMSPTRETDRVALLEPDRISKPKQQSQRGASAVLRFWAETSKEEKEAAEEWKDRDPSVVDLDETDVVDNTYDASLTSKLLRNASQGDDAVRSVRSWRSQGTPKSSNEPRELDPFSLEDAPSWGQVVLNQTRNDTIFDPFATTTFEDNIEDLFANTADPFSTTALSTNQRPPRKSSKFNVFPPGTERAVTVPKLPPSDRDNVKYSHGVGEDYSVSKLHVGDGKAGSVHSNPWSYDADDNDDGGGGEI